MRQADVAIVPNILACERRLFCITNEYMAATSVMTLRIDPDLLESLRRRAKQEGRSVSAEVVRMISKELSPTPVPHARRRRTMGMFASFESPELEEFKRLRREISRTFQPRTRTRSA